MVTVRSKLISSLIIGTIYMLALVAALITCRLLPSSTTMVTVLAADVAATIVVFIFSMIFTNSSMYDPYWSVAPLCITIYLTVQFPQGNRFRQILILILVLFWSIRLTANWFRGWKGMHQQDWRYSSISEKTGRWFWPVSFLGIHLVPTLVVFLGCLPLWYSISARSPLNLIDILAALFALIAILTEWIADEQLIRFRKTNVHNASIRSGLWKYSRHPNYLGEISFWCAMYLFVFPSTAMKNLAGYWTIVGPIAMVLLFRFVSIPMMEKRNLTNKAGYAEYLKQVPALFPRYHKENPS